MYNIFLKLNNFSLTSPIYSGYSFTHPIYSVLVTKVHNIDEKTAASPGVTSTTTEYVVRSESYAIQFLIRGKNNSINIFHVWLPATVYMPIIIVNFSECIYFSTNYLKYFISYDKLNSCTPTGLFCNNFSQLIHFVYNFLYLSKVFGLLFFTTGTSNIYKHSQRNDPVEKLLKCNISRYYEITDKRYHAQNIPYLIRNRL